MQIKKMGEIFGSSNTQANELSIQERGGENYYIGGKNKSQEDGVGAKVKETRI